MMAGADLSRARPGCRRKMERSMRLLLAALLAGAPALCGLAQNSQPEARPTGLHHIDVTQVDSSVNPCDDFWQYTCGKLNAANPIPPDQMFWGVAGELEQWNQQVLRQILDKNEAAGSPRTANQQKIGDLYASCMDQASSKADDLSAIQPLIEQIRSLKDKHAIAAVLAAIHTSFGHAWEGGDNQTNVALIGYGPAADYNDVSRVVGSVDQAGLGMPGRDFYLRDDADSKVVRDKYVALIVALLKLDGSTAEAAAQDAAIVMRIETAMAQAQMDNITRRDPNKVNNRYTLAQLKELTPAFNWDSYFKGIGAPSVPLYEVSAPEFLRALNKLLTNEDLAAWKAYLRWHLLLTAASSLGNAWRDASFAFESALLGQPQPPPDWRRCTTAVDHYVGEALGQVFVEQAFPPESKARALKMVKDIEAAMGRDIDAVTWM
jgi:putative endopeptidase